MSVKVVNSGSGVIKITASTLPAVKVEEPEVNVIKVNPIVTGNITAPAGPTGPAGATGEGIPSGGEEGQFVIKTDDGTEWSYVHVVTEIVNNASGGTLAKGTPVHITGEDADGNPTVIRARADQANTMPCHFVLNETISDGATGEAILSGMIQNVNTTGYSSGEALFVGTGSSLYTTVKPTGANLIQKIAVVSHVHASEGTGYVMGAGRTNDVPNIEDGKIWIGDALGIPTPTLLKATIIPDFDVEVSNNTDVVANTAKETNVTTDLSFTRDATSVTVVSSDGTDAVLPESSLTQAGVMSAASHTKLANLSAAADATTETTVSAAGAVMDSDFTANGLMERTGDGAYTTVAKSTTSIPEGTNLYYTDGRADARIAAASVADLSDGSDVVLTSTSDVSSASFVDTDDTFASATNNLVPSQLAVKTYVDNQLGNQNLSLGSVTGTAVSVDISGGTSVTLPAATTSAAGVMTEAQFDKLDAIEANADVTDTANVTSAGALMDSEVTNLQDVKDFDPADYATAAQGSTADNALPTSGGTMTGNIVFSGTQTVDGRDLSDDGAKLDTIEDNADVTDSDNVVTALVLADSISGAHKNTIKNNLDIGATPSTTDDLDDVSAAATNDGEILIYNSGTGDYDPATITGGDNVTVTNSAGGIEISADGGGLTYTPLATLSGRFQWNSTDDNRTILCGNTSYGTNYYLWSTKVFNTVTNGIPDVTVQSISTSYSGVSFRILESKKIRWEYNHRPINSNGAGKRYKAQIWSSATMPSSGSSSSWTLRGESDVVAGSSSTRWVSGFALTKSAIPAGHYVMFVFGLTETITATTYLVLQSQTYLQS